MSQDMAAVASQRKRLKHTCPCGKVFEALKTAKYCSNACRQRAKYQRSKG